MDDILYFRSRYTSTRAGGDHGKKISGRSSEVGEIRQFEQSDDARDIAWKQSAKSETETYTKIRKGDTTHDIILIEKRTGYDDFFLPSHKRSRNTFIEELDSAIERSKKIVKISYRNLIQTPDSPDDLIIKNLIQSKIQNSIILIATGSLESESFHGFDILARHNDIIILHIFHPIELAPEISAGILFESKKIDTRKYMEAFEKKQKECEKLIKKLGMSYILVSSAEDPVLKLNFHFKHRYVR